MRLVFLDVIRIYAAFSVYFTHNLSSFSDQYINNNFNSVISIILIFLSNLTKYGGSGVFCFFLVSGYIIHKSILTSSAHVFMIKRFFRIYPAYALICIVSFFSTHTLTSVIFEDFYSLFLQISLLGDFFNLDYGLGGVEWTLRMELYFYIIMYIFRFFDIFNNKFFSLNYVIFSFLLNQAGPIPTTRFTSGYISLYLPIIFIGSCFYQIEHKTKERFFNICISVGLFVGHLLMCIIFNKPNDYFMFAIIGMGVFCFFWSIRNYILFLDSIVYWPASLTYVVYLSHKWINELNIIGTYFGTSLLRIFVVFFVVIIVSFFVHMVIERPGVAIGRSILRKKIFL